RKHRRVGELVVGAIDLCNDISETVADQELQHQPADDVTEAGLDLRVAGRAPRDLTQLSKIRLGTLDRAADDLREKSREEEEDHRVALDRFLVPRSEEHTSELQSHHDLVCRL